MPADIPGSGFYNFLTKPRLGNRLRRKTQTAGKIITGEIR
jgi:hypothetical protein